MRLGPRVSGWRLWASVCEGSDSRSWMPDHGEVVDPVAYRRRNRRRVWIFVLVTAVLVVVGSASSAWPPAPGCAARLHRRQW